MKQRWFFVLVLTLLILSGCGTSDTDDEPVIEETLLPVLFIHGTSGSASQFESQAQRFLANGYPSDFLGTFEYDSSPFSQAAAVYAATGDSTQFSALLYNADFQARINAAIDKLLSDSGEEKVNLIGHSLGTLVSNAFLKTDTNAERIAHYVSVDGTDGSGVGTPWGGVDTLALWGMQNPDATATGDTATDDHNNDQSHIQVCTSASSFGKIYQFFNNEAPITTEIPESTGDTVEIAGKVNIFPENVGAENTVLNIYEVNPATGFAVSDDPVDDGWAIGSDGNWGPVTVSKGATYMFLLEHDTETDATQVYYREPFYADNYFIRLNTAYPGEGIASLLTRGADHSLLMISRDKEMWGDQGDGNDDLRVNGDSVLTEDAAMQERRLSSLFLCDNNENQTSDMTTLSDVTQTSFIAGIDYYAAAASPADETLSITLKSRGSDVTQTINVPNWSSDEVRTISVHFRDFVR